MPSVFLRKQKKDDNYNGEEDQKIKGSENHIALKVIITVNMSSLHYFRFYQFDQNTNVFQFIDFS
jgi:hypothetical protein